MLPDADTRAPGAAITAELCGDWQHEPPCPLPPHATTAEGRGDGELGVRVLFAATPAQEQTVRRAVETALSRQCSSGPDGGETRWEVCSSSPALVRADEQERADRIALS